MSSELSQKIAAEVQRPDFGLRLIIVWKAIKATLLVAIVIYLLRQRWLFVPGRIGRWWQARRATAGDRGPR